MGGNATRYLRVALIVLLAIVAVVAWMSFMGLGIAYGSIVGLPGRERDLAVIGSRASSALATAVACEALTVGSVSWLFLPLREPAWARATLAVACALVADLLTFGAVRSL
jgi:hypothetical protein